MTEGGKDKNHPGQNLPDKNPGQDSPNKIQLPVKTYVCMHVLLKIEDGEWYEMCDIL